MADKIFYKMLFSIPCTFLFYLFLLKLFKYFFRKAENYQGAQHKEEERYFKHDLLIAAILYSICTLLFFYPCISSINNSLIGPPEDNMQHFWDMWWVNKVVKEHNLNLSFSNYIFYPEGTSLLYHAYSFYNLALSFLLRRLFNPVTTYNLLILHSFPISGTGAFLLIRYLTKNSYLGLIGGFIFAFNPSHFAHSLHHVEISSIQFIPFFVLFFIKAVKGNSKKDLYLAGLFFFLTSVCAWYHLAFSIYFIGFSYIYLAIRRKRFFLRDVLIKSAIIVGTTAIILSPWLLRMIYFRFKYPGVEQYGGINTCVADIFALFTPHPYHLLAGLEMVKNINARFTGFNWKWEITVYLGIINISIILFTFRKIIKDVAKYFLGFFSFLILSMGAFVHTLGWVTPIILPYSAINFVPFLSNVRSPSRIIVYVYLFLAVIIAFGLKHFIDSYKSGLKRKCLLTTVVFLLFFDYYSVCNLMTKVYLPPCYNAIKREEKVFGILDIPGYYDVNARYMMYQTFHNIPIVQGSISRRAGHSLIDYLESKDLLKEKKRLIENNVKYIIIHKKLLFELLPKNPEQYKRSLQAIDKDIAQFAKVYKLIYEDGENIVFQVY